MYVVLDLEATCGAFKGHIGKDQTEIIEIGALLLDEKLNEVKRFRSFVCPAINRKLTGICKRITGIKQQDISNALRFKAIIHVMQQHFEVSLKDVTLCTWSTADITHLKNDCRNQGVEYPFSESNFIDLRGLAGKFFGLPKNESPGVSTALKRLGLTFVGREHSALDDAINSAAVFRKITEHHGTKGNRSDKG